MSKKSEFSGDQGWQPSQPEVIFSKPNQLAYYPSGITIRKYEANPLGERRLVEEKHFKLEEQDKPQKSFIEVGESKK